MSRDEIARARRRLELRTDMRRALALAFADARLLDSGGILIVPRAIWNGWRAALLRSAPRGDN